MRQLSGCDFCGGTASGTFEVLPAEYDPEGEGKRMLLCDHCRDALSSILDPLLDAKAGREPAGDVEPDLTPATDADTDDTPDRNTSDNDPSEPVDTAEPAETDDAAEETGAGETGGDETGADAGDDAVEEPDRGSQMAATGAGTSSRVPKGYRKVLRFLENREMPMDRQEAVEMTAGAYDMDEEAVDAAIEHAVGHGRLKSYDGEIRRT